MKNLLSFLLALVLCVGLAVPALAEEAEAPDTPAFSDVPEGHYAYEAIAWCASRGVAEGYADGSFRPGETVSRGQFLLMLAQVFFPEETASEEERQTADPWCRKEALVLAKAGALQGLGWKESEVWPHNVYKELTRYEMALLAYNLMAANFRSVSTSNQIAVQGQIADWDQIPERYAVAVAGAFARGIVTGYAGGTFSGGEAVNSAQACVVIHRLVEFLGIAMAPAD